ncbi:sulfurtransferase [Antrihabitans sp. YC2-6]|uniref:sulfurtransferase n=1 Tax=Antrihabitans sp. YC2-6 TaxID=2799498 RepID=UPI0018F5EF4E|nr:sulfurtransferase [Antrihabitans sp. YC2-6]MBJ8348106.1 sulfurtransferase [Antrihabitans sp. YC2-6]
MPHATPVLVTVAELRPGAVLLDVRWALGDPRGREHYLEGHIPGAVFVDLETDLAAPPSRAAGRHPLPSVQDLQDSARRWGIHNDSSVVVYDATGGLAAARAWWLLRWGGLGDVRILDGGLAAWLAAGRQPAQGYEQPAALGSVALTGGGMPIIEIDDAATWSRHGTLLDARAAERYRGEVEPVDRRAGHVPGAVNAPTTENIDSSGRFKSADLLADRFAGVVGPVAVYCGSGVTAAHEIAALAVAGIEAALYPGSWSQWSGDDARAVATGHETRSTDNA